LALAIIVFDLVHEIYDDLLDLYHLGQPERKEGPEKQGADDGEKGEKKNEGEKGEGPEKKGARDKEEEPKEKDAGDGDKTKGKEDAGKIEEELKGAAEEGAGK